MEEMWILLTPLAAYVSKLSGLAPRLGFFLALDVYMTRLILGCKIGTVCFLI